MGTKYLIKRHHFEIKPKDKVKEISTKYYLPSNLKELLPTKVNLEFWRACTPATREFDLKIEVVQNNLDLTQV